MKSDIDIWNEYHQYRLFHNKLWINEQAGNVCGPRGIDVPAPGYYCVRPVYNLCGMGTGASKVWLDKDTEGISLGFFWAEWLEGRHLSIDYVNGIPNRCVEGIRNSEDPLYKFRKWVKTSDYLELPAFLQHISIPCINVEYIGNKLIEVHLRGNPDPDYDELIVVWKSDGNNLNYNFIESIEEFGEDTRLGFIYG